MVVTKSATFEKNKYLSPGMLTKRVGNDWIQLGGYLDMEVTSEPTKTEGLATHDGIDGSVTLRRDGKASFTLLVAKNIVLLEQLFGFNSIDYTLGSITAITGEQVMVDMLSGDGIYEAVLSKASGDGTLNTLVVVKDSTGVTTYVLDTDYTIESFNGKTAIRMISGGAITAGQELLIDYSYLPMVSATARDGNAKVLTANEFKFTETPTAAGSALTDEIMEVHFTLADVVSGFGLKFRDADGEAEEYQMPVEIENRKGADFYIKTTARV